MMNKEAKKAKKPPMGPEMPGMEPGKMDVLPGLGEPPEVFKRYSRVSAKPGARRGPGGPGPRGPRFGGPRGKMDKGTALRLAKMVLKPYWYILLIVLVCIVVSAQASVQASLFLKTLIDDYITPLASQQHPALNGLVRAVFQMALIYAAGIVSTWLYNFLMVSVSQGTLKKLRDQMFSHMQTLPIKYFDTHSHGDVMSRYTNDTETLRNLIGSAVPQLISSAITVVTVLVNMILLDIYLTIFTLAFVVVMMLVTKKIGAKSARYFVAQQATLGALNGFVEEMVNGQKVVKVFNHEPTARDEFDQLNDALYIQANEANKLGNIMGPIMGNLGNLQYILLAVIGGALAIGGVGGLTLGSIVAFLQLSRSFSMPISQISQQVNTIVSAMAGAQRVFRLLDEPSEADEGYVTLVNANVDENGNITESAARTGKWAWKHPHKADGSVIGNAGNAGGEPLLHRIGFSHVMHVPAVLQQSGNQRQVRSHMSRGAAAGENDSLHIGNPAFENQIFRIYCIISCSFEKCYKIDVKLLFLLLNLVYYIVMDFTGGALYGISGALPGLAAPEIFGNLRSGRGGHHPHAADFFRTHRPCLSVLRHPGHRQNLCGQGVFPSGELSGYLLGGALRKM